MEFARQFVRDNNGRLLATDEYLKKRGWRSVGVIYKAKLELIANGFIHETVTGHRPNKASWYAVTWQTLDKIPGYDAGAAETFRRGAYRTALAKPKRPAPQCKRNKKVLTPPHGVEAVLIAPPHGANGEPPTPSPGAAIPTFSSSLTPLDGNHLEKPSLAVGTQPGIAVAGMRRPLECTGHADRHHWLTYAQIGHIQHLTNQSCALAP